MRSADRSEPDGGASLMEQITTSATNARCSGSVVGDPELVAALRDTGLDVMAAATGG
jgi:hypothetical protein